jgi:LPS-assembly protein
MKNKYLWTLLFVFLNFTNYVLANEIIFDGSNIVISENGNRIISNKGVARSTDHSLIIEANNFDYNKRTSILLASKNALATLIKKNITINANKFIYNKNLSILNAIGDVNIYDSANDITIISNEILYDFNQNKIESNTPSEIKDKVGNLFLTKSFIYTLNNSIIKFNNLKFIDFEKNVSKINTAFINLKSKKLLGKDVSIDFNNQNFNEDNEPRLKGTTVVSEGGNTIITKGIFTTCKKNDDCPPWQLSAEKVIHDKEKKTIYYDDAWLKIYDKPVFYFPKFFHPDPTVKRQSGFLMPSFNVSSNIGSSFDIPYYHVLSDNKDFTIRPRFYSEEKLLLQSEYRQVNFNSSHLLDFSILNGADLTSKGHLFLNTYQKLNFSYFDESDLNITLEQVEGDTYLKTYNLKSPIINNTGSLESSVKIDAYKENLLVDLEFTVFENLSKRDSDRYEYILPTYNVIKDFENNFGMNGVFSLNSSGSMKNYNTNVSEKIVINDFYFKSNPIFSNNGIINKYNFLLKNTNTDADNSSKYEGNVDHNLGALLEYNSSYPLKQITKKYDNIFRPTVSLRYSPSNTRNIKNEETRVNVSNIYSLNRISRRDTVEGGTSFTYGAEFLKTNREGLDFLNINVANIIRDTENKNLPRNSSLGHKLSDVFGNIDFNPNDIISTGYEFTIDNNFTDINYEIFKGGVKINNFVTEFEYLNENNTLGKKSFLSNKTSYNIDKSNKLSFETRENKKTSLTEFYNLIYQYRNDCLIAAIEYNKNYYSDRDLKPSENIFFKLTIVPFGQTNSPNLIK